MTAALGLLKQELSSKGIPFSLIEDDSNVINYGRSTPYLSVEVTQLFENSNCEMTYMNKAWRETVLPKTRGALGTIDICISEYGTLTASTLIPGNHPADEDFIAQLQRTVESVIRQEMNVITEGMTFQRMMNKASLFVALEPRPGEPQSANSTVDLASPLVQLFALELLRIYGNTSIIA